jgi:hypothetical protein
MNTPEEIKETLVKITSLLKSADIPFHITGGLVFMSTRTFRRVVGRS